MKRIKINKVLGICSYCGKYVTVEEDMEGMDICDSCYDKQLKELYEPKKKNIRH